MDDQFVIFNIADRAYALPIRHVHEVLRAVELNPPPVDDPRVEGILNLRGRAVPVADVRRELGLPSSDVAPAHFLIVVEADSGVVAVRVDGQVEMSDIEPVDFDDATGHGHRLIESVSKYRDRIVYLINPHALADLMNFDAAKAAGGGDSGSEVNG